MHSGCSESSQTLTKTHAARPRFERLEHEALLCILLYKIARHPAAWVNIVLWVRVPRVCRMLRADDWYDTQSICVSEHAETHTAQSVTCEVQIKPVGEYCQLCSLIWSAVVCITFAMWIFFFFFSVLAQEMNDLVTNPPPPDHTILFISSCAPCFCLQISIVRNLFIIRIYLTFNPSDECFK